MRARRRSWWKLLMVFALGAQFLRAENPAPVPQKDEGRLPGSILKEDDIILKADAIIVAKFLKTGSESTVGSQLTMHENQAMEIQFLRGGTQSPLEIDVSVDFAKAEKKPESGKPYIFFLVKNYARPTAWGMDPYDAIKLMDATDANIAEVKRLVMLPVNYNQLTGSRVKVDEATKKSNHIFVGTVVSVPYPDLGPPGVAEYFGMPVRISYLLCGPAPNPFVVDFRTIWNPHEGPPEAGKSYLFFVAQDPAYTNVAKILPATAANIAQVKQLLPRPRKTGAFPSATTLARTMRWSPLTLFLRAESRLPESRTKTT